MRAIRFDSFGDYAELKPVTLPIRTFPLEQAAEAQRHLDQDRPFGKVLIEVQEPG